MFSSVEMWLENSLLTFSGIKSDIRRHLQYAFQCTERSEIFFHLAVCVAYNFRPNIHIVPLVCLCRKLKPRGAEVLAETEWSTEVQKGEVSCFMEPLRETYCVLNLGTGRTQRNMKVSPHEHMTKIVFRSKFLWAGTGIRKMLMGTKILLRSCFFSQLFLRFV